MYQLASAGPVWLDLFKGVRIWVEPVSRGAARAAGHAYRAALADKPDDLEAAGDALSAEIIRRGLKGWAGIADAEGTAELGFGPASVEAFLADPTLFDAADVAYVGPWIAREAEKNGYSLSRAGTSAGATVAKDTAESAKSTATRVPTSSRRRNP